LSSGPNGSIVCGGVGLVGNVNVNLVENDHVKGVGTSTPGGMVGGTGHLSSDSKHSVSLRKGDDAGHPHPVTHRHACRKLVMPQRLGQGARAHRFGQLCHSKSPKQISLPPSLHTAADSSSFLWQSTTPLQSCVFFMHFLLGDLIHRHSSFLQGSMLVLI